MSAKKRPITTPPKRVEFVSDHLFAPTIRRRQKGGSRPPTSKKIRGMRERAFQLQLKALRGAEAPPLIKEKKLPDPIILGGRSKRRTALDYLKEKLGK